MFRRMAQNMNPLRASISPAAFLLHTIDSGNLPVARLRKIRRYFDTPKSKKQIAPPPPPEEATVILQVNSTDSVLTIPVPADKITGGKLVSIILGQLEEADALAVDTAALKAIFQHPSTENRKNSEAKSEPQAFTFSLREMTDVIFTVTPAEAIPLKLELAQRLAKTGKREERTLKYRGNLAISVEGNAITGELLVKDKGALARALFPVLSAKDLLALDKKINRILS